MNNDFWHAIDQPFFILAPMEAVTDVVFRQTIWRAGEIAVRDHGGSLIDNEPDIMMSEFTNTASFVSEKGKFSTRGRLTFTPDETKNGRHLVAQIWGKNPTNFREMSHQLFERGFSGVDINMGCPDKNVVAGGAGAGLIDTPETASEIIRATQNGFYDYLRQQSPRLAVLNDDKIRQIIPTTTIPISVKTRLGLRRADEFRIWLPTILHERPTNLTVHLRSRKEMSKVPAHYELIAEILKLRDEVSPQTLLTINGDISSKAQALKLRDQHVYHNSKIDGFMIGRGVFNNPFTFTSISAPTRAQLFELLRFQLDKYDEFQDIGEWQGKIIMRKFDPLKHFFKIYANGFSGAKKLRETMMNAQTTIEVRQLLDQFEDKLYKDDA
ncbi:MAG: tRNA-dihydrouridine synthase family protein [Candidatus Nanoperiomorbaceae bacterium]